MKPRLRARFLLLLLVAGLASGARAMQIVMLDTSRGGGGGAPAGPATAAPLAVDPRAPRWVAAVFADAETARRVTEPLLPRPLPPPPAATEGEAAAAAPPPSARARHILMTDGDGRRFNCTVPTGPVSVDDGGGGGGGGRSQLKGPPPLPPAAELLDALAGVCLYHQDAAGWTYEVCHRRQVRQFRGAGAAGGSEDFICGRYGGGAKATTGGGGGEAGAAAAAAAAAAKAGGGGAGGAAWPLPPNHPSRFLDEEQDEEVEAMEAMEGEGGESGTNKTPSSSPSSSSSSSSRDEDEALLRVDRRGIGGGGLSPGTPFLRHVYGAGASCALGNGQPRTAEVRYVCSDAAAVAAGAGQAGGGSWAGGGQAGALVSVREFPSCHYVATVATPVLCAHPAFAARREDVRLVACAPLDDDEEEEGGGGGGGASAAAAATQESSSSTGAAEAEAAEAAELRRRGGGGGGGDEASAKAEAKAKASEKDEL